MVRRVARKTSGALLIVVPFILIGYFGWIEGSITAVELWAVAGSFAFVAVIMAGTWLLVGGNDD